MKILYVGTRLQVNGATKVAVKQCNFLYRRGHHVRLAILGKENIDWCNPEIHIEYLTNLKQLEISEDELVVTLDSFVNNWFVKNYGSDRVVQLIQVDETKLYKDRNLVKAVEHSYALSNPKITVSEYLRDIVKKYGNDSCVITPAISDDIFFSKERLPPKKGESFSVLVVGSYSHPLKRIEMAYSALKKLEQCGINVILKRLSRKKDENAPKSIITDWYVNPSQEELGNIYRESDAVLVTSKSEGFGLVILEAMACGVPFVTTNNGGCNDIIDYKNSLVVETDDINAIVEALYNLANDPVLWLRIRNDGLLNAKKYSWSKSVERLEEFLLYTNDKVQAVGD